MLQSYLQRLYDTIISRGYVEVNVLVVDDLAGRQGSIEGQLKFFDGSLLDFDEALLLRSNQIVKLRYAYHYQDESGRLIFRYDNAPHYPNIHTYPHHKHVGSAVEPSQIPDISDVFREIERLIFKAD